MQTNCGFKMKYNSTVDMRKVYEAMEAGVMSTVDKEGYYELWLQDLADCCEDTSFKIDSTLYSEEFVHYVPAMCKAVAEAFPSVEFEASAWYDDLRCYWVDDFEVSYKGHLLSITETLGDQNRQ